MVGGMVVGHAAKGHNRTVDAAISRARTAIKRIVEDWAWQKLRRWWRRPE